MGKPLRIIDSCVPRPEVLKSDLEDAIFAADFKQVMDQNGPDVYCKPDIFFKNTYPTDRLKKIVSTIFGRLGDPKEQGMIARLSTGFGGGKTHTLIALWHLANNIGNTGLGTDLLPGAGRVKKIRVAGLDGEKAGSKVFDRIDGEEIHTVWTALAARLGGKDAWDKFRDMDDPEVTPDRGLIESILPNEPTLILIDEIVIYMSHLSERAQGALLAFISQLMSITLNRSQMALVISDPAAQLSYEKDVRMLEQVWESNPQHRLDDILGRRASDFDPVGSEAPQIIARRLFESVDRSAAESVSAAYSGAYKRFLEEDASRLPGEVATTEFAQSIVNCYPFHPRLFDTAQMRLSAMNEFNRSRGTLRLFARILRDVFKSDASDHIKDLDLVTEGDIDWKSDRIQSDLLQRLNRDRLIAAVNADVERHAGELDKLHNTRMHRRVASAILFESIPLTEKSTMNRAEVNFAVLKPSNAGPEASDALDRLISVCWHLYRSAQQDSWHFKDIPNVLREIEEHAKTLVGEDIRVRIRTIIQSFYGGKTIELAKWPLRPNEVPDNDKVRLVLCEDANLAPSILKNRSVNEDGTEDPRMFKNTLFAIAPAQDLYNRAFQKVRMHCAAEDKRIEARNATKDGQDRIRYDEIERLMPELQRQARFETIRSFNRLYLPKRGKFLSIPEKVFVPDKVMKLAQGQQALIDFLTSQGSKEKQQIFYDASFTFDSEWFVEKVLPGATPSSIHPDSWTTKAIENRALQHADVGLFLMLDRIRGTLKNAIDSGLLVLLDEGGRAWSKGHVVDGAEDERRKRYQSLQSVQISEDTFIALADSDTAKEWMKVTYQPPPPPKEDSKNEDDPPTPPPPPPPPGHQMANSWHEATEFAAKRPVEKLILNLSDPDKAITALGKFIQFGAEQTAWECVLVGKLRSGGTVKFSLQEATQAALYKPIDDVLRLLRVVETSEEERPLKNLKLHLRFGDEGKMIDPVHFERLDEDPPEGQEDCSIWFGKEQDETA